MAEALAIVGLASNVVQFIDAAGNFLTFFNELYKSRSLGEYSAIEQHSKNLETSLELLRSRSSYATNVHLKTMVEGCIQLSKDLHSLLGGLKPKQGKGRLSQALLSSFKTLRKKSEIKKFEDRLTKLRDAICTHLTIILRQNDEELTVWAKDLAAMTKLNHQDIKLQLDRVSLDVRRMLDGQAWNNGHHPPNY